MLRRRLFLNLIPFVAILLAVGLYAIMLFGRATADVGATVTANYRSVLAAQQMKQQLIKMEEGVLQAMQDNQALGAAIFQKSKAEFDDSLAQQLKNGKTPYERDLNERLQTNYLAFSQACTEILALKEPEERRRLFRQNLEAGVPAVDTVLDKIHMQNDTAILATTQHIEEMTAHVTQLMLVALAVALGLAAYAVFKLARSVLGPIQSLTRATQAMGKGNLDQTVPVTSEDELGALADSFNKMAAQLRLYKQSTAEKIVRLNRTMDATLASFPDPVFVLNREGDIEFKNLAATELARSLGLKDELPEHVQDKARKALADGKSFMAHSFKEVVSFRLNGKDNFFLPRVLVMRNEEEALIGVAVVLYDVTRFRLLDDAKTNLVSTVSHEIRTPLTSVRMVLHLLLEKTVGTLTSRQNELIITARDDLERLLKIISDLLDLTRLEEGNPDLKLEPTAPADLVQNVADIMKEGIAQKNLKLTCRTKPGLPPVLVDRQRINHVFTNLINNAMKYSPPGGEIVLEADWTDGQEVEFRVTDQGPGVPEDHQDRIFDRFYRVPGQTKTGAGLGLSIAREIVVAHGGRIGVKNGDKQGAEFYFVLEQADGAQAA